MAFKQFGEFFGRRVAPEDDVEVEHGDVGDRDPDAAAVQFPPKVGKYPVDRLGRPGRRGDHVDGGGAGAADIFFMGHVQDVLIVRVGVDGRHQPLLDPEGFVENPGDGRQAVRGAAGVGENALAGVAGFVDPHDEVGGSLILGRSAEQHFSDTVFKMDPGSLSGQEASRALQDDIGAACGADVVLECTGRFLTREAARVHLENGVGKVLFSAPAQDEGTPHFVMGVNETRYAGERILSNASCTTNCLAPIARILDETFGIEKGLMTTIHSYTNDQNILDVAHEKDIRRSRAAAVNMIPTTTGAAKAIDRVLPNLRGKLHGRSVRVPVPDVSMLDLDVVLGRDTTAEELAELFKSHADGALRGILHVDTRRRVSQDFVGSPFSAIVAEDLLQVIGGNLVKIMAWYDNEWGYSNRLVDMAVHISTDTSTKE